MILIVEVIKSYLFRMIYLLQEFSFFNGIAFFALCCVILIYLIQFVFFLCLPFRFITRNINNKFEQCHGLHINQSFFINTRQFYSISNRA
jgi:hypothetical protein